MQNVALIVWCITLPQCQQILVVQRLRKVATLINKTTPHANSYGKSNVNKKASAKKPISSVASRYANLIAFGLPNVQMMAVTSASTNAAAIIASKRPTISSIVQPLYIGVGGGE